MARVPVWERDSTAICDRLCRSRGVFKIILKTRDEPELLDSWVRHHARIVGPENIIVADNGSTDVKAVAILSSLAQSMTVFTFSGFHNDLHVSTGKFKNLYLALQKSCLFYMPIDTDERLYWVDETGWIADERIVARIRAAMPFSLLPAALINNFPFAMDTLSLDPGESPGFGVTHAVKWGKPVVSSSLPLTGEHRLHNCQFPQDLLPATGGINLVSLHLMYFDPHLRLKADRNKLVARGVVDPQTSFQDIAALPDGAVPNDGVSPRLRLSISKMLDLLSGTSSATWGNPNPDHAVKLQPDGTLTFGSMATDIALKELVNHGASLLAETFTNVTLSGRREQELRRGMDMDPARIDQYGDPTYRKELIRFLLADGRWQDAEAIAPKGTEDIGLPGWHHILFARAYDRIGRHDEAEHHWRAFIVNRPHHPEALTRLSLLSRQTATRPATDGDA